MAEAGTALPSPPGFGGEALFPIRREEKAAVKCPIWHGSEELIPRQAGGRLPLVVARRPSLKEASSLTSPPVKAQPASI